MILGNESTSRTPSGYKVAPMSYAKLEDVAERLRPLLPLVAGSGGNRIDAWRTLEITLRKAGYEYRSEESASLDDCAAFTIPERRLIVLREDVYDGVTEENVFSRSTVIHELSHIVLEHAVTLQRGPIGQHRFFEDSYLRGIDDPQPSMLAFNMEVVGRGMQILLGFVTGLFAQALDAYEQRSFLRPRAGAMVRQISKVHRTGCPICSAVGCGADREMTVRQRAA